MSNHSYCAFTVHATRWDRFTSARSYIWFIPWDLEPYRRRSMLQHRHRFAPPPLCASMDKKSTVSLSKRQPPEQLSTAMEQISLGGHDGATLMVCSECKSNDIDKSVTFSSSLKSIGGGSATGGSHSPMNAAAARVLTHPNESTPPNDKIDLNSVHAG
jgi:hypothetical protein